jgi:hypothetical protein
LSLAARPSLRRENVNHFRNFAKSACISTIPDVTRMGRERNA